MKEWEKELQLYRLAPAPPKENDLQKYILYYLSEKDDNISHGFFITTSIQSTTRQWLLFRIMRCSGISWISSRRI